MRFEGLIGIRMWNRMVPIVNTMNDEALEYIRRIGVLNNVFTDEWFELIMDIEFIFYAHTSGNLYKRATKILKKLYKAEERLHYAMLHFKRDGDFTSMYEETWKTRIKNCTEKIRETMTYCETISKMDKKNTWDACELAVYFIKNKMKTETAVKICKELGAITKEHLLEINKSDIYGDLKIKYAGLSLSDPQKDELYQICNVMHAEAEAAKAQAKVEAEAEKAEAARSEVIKSKMTTEPEEMDEGTYIGEKVNGKRHGWGFMFYKNNDTYDGNWRNDKMNGRGEFRKNVRSLEEYDWEFYGNFIDNCPRNGVVRKQTDNQGLLIEAEKGVNIFNWFPFKEETKTSKGLQNTDGFDTTQLLLKLHALS